MRILQVHAYMHQYHVSATDSPAVELIYQISLGDCTDTVTISSDQGFTSFKYQIAEAMDLPSSTLSIAYKYSTETKSELPHALSTAMHYMKMVEKAKEIIKEQAKGRGKKKQLVIKITNLAAAKEKGDSKKSKAAKKVCL